MTHSSYPTVNIPEQLLDVVIDELWNYSGYLEGMSKGKYAKEILELMASLEAYRGSPTTARKEE